MKSYLLTFFSTVLLLFTLSPSDGQVSGFPCAIKQSELKESKIAIKSLVKRPCAKQCLKHQAHSEQQNAANIAPDCSQQFYAVLDTAASEENFTSHALQLVHVPVDEKHSAPSLESEPEPPRCS